MNLMKQATSILLIFLFLLQAFGSTVLLSNYYINKDYIASVLCINKSKPKLKCNGKCHLSKQLKTAEENEKAPFNSPFEKVNFQLFSKSLNQIMVLNIADYQSEQFSDYSLPNYEQQLSAVFHPPQA